MMKKWLMVLCTCCGLVTASASRAEIHALIMTIGDYQAGIPRLKGVAHDGESARAIAHLLGVKDENILQLHDVQLTLEGMRHAFDELERRVVAGDKVFVYYSGHGSRQRVSDPEERCAESLVTVNGYALIDAEMETRLKQLAERAQKIIAMFDACHSGGATVRSLGGHAAFAPKFWSKGGESTCEKPVNVLTRNLGLAARTAGSGGRNYVYIAAAKDNEISLDQPGKGGVATQAWLACMSGEAVDQDHSGGLTVEEIRRCAQARIDAQLKDVEGFLPHHISVTGNPDLVMTLAANDPDVPPAPSVQVAMPQAPAVVHPAIPPQQQESLPPSTLLDIYNGRDDRRTVEILPDKSRLRIGSDKFSFSVRSSQEGYLYLVMVGSDGKTFDVLFPNKLDGNNYIQAGQPIRFPRSNWEIIAQGPAGKDHLLAIVADAPRDLAKLPLLNVGPFSMVENTSSGKRGIQLVTSTPTVAVQDECSDAGRRSLQVARTCSDAYGAALVTVEEVR